MTPSTRTQKSWCEATLARWAALKVNWYVPAARPGTTWLNEPVLQEADLSALGGVGVAGSEAAAVAGHTGAPV